MYLPLKQGILGSNPAAHIFFLLIFASCFVVYAQFTQVIVVIFAGKL